MSFCPPSLSLSAVHYQCYKLLQHTKITNTKNLGSEVAISNLTFPQSVKDFTNVHVSVRLCKGMRCSIRLDYPWVVVVCTHTHCTLYRESSRLFGVGCSTVCFLILLALWSFYVLSPYKEDENRMQHQLSIAAHKDKQYLLQVDNKG